MNSNKPSRAERQAVAETKRKALMVEFSEILSRETKEHGNFSRALATLNEHVLKLAEETPQDKALLITAVREFERRFNSALDEVKARIKSGEIRIESKEPEMQGLLKQIGISPRA